MPTLKITRDVVRGLEPRQRLYEIRDAELNGLILRVYPSGRMVYVAQFARGRRTTVGRADVLTPSDARAKAQQILADAAKGIDPAEDKRRAKSPTLSEYLDGEYGEWAEQHYSDGDATVRRLKATFPDLLKVRLQEITPWHVEKWRTARQKKGVPVATTNRQLNQLKAVFKKASELGGPLYSNPLAGAAKMKKVDSKAIVRYLSDAEEVRLMAAIDARESKLCRQRRSANKWRANRGYKLLPSLSSGRADHLKPMVIVSLNTGVRQGELFNLKWADIDFDTAMLTVRGEGAKSGQTRHVPLNDVALAALKTWGRGEATDYVFPGENGARLTNVRTAWAKVLEVAKVTGFRWHDLRHTFASRLVIAGVDLNTVRELLGHADMKMTIRYAHLAPHVKVDAVSRLVSVKKVGLQAVSGDS